MASRVDDSKAVSASTISAQEAGRVLQDALDELRASSRTEDFYSNYSLGEAIAQRLAIIGNSEGGTDELTARGVRTRFARVDFIESSVEEAVERLKALPRYIFRG